MKQGTKDFQETLKRGLDFEQGEALDVLHAHFPNYYIINNKTDPVASTNGKEVGPRMYKGKDREIEVILPDFTLFYPDAPGEPAMWVDAKLKGASYPHQGRDYFTIDRKKHAAYRNFPDFVRQHFFLLFKHEKTGDVFLTMFNPEPDTVYFNNKWGKGDTPVYFLDQLTYMGTSSK